MKAIGMALNVLDHEVPLGDPIELVSRLVANQDWLLQRRAENAVLAEVPGNGAIISWR